MTKTELNEVTRKTKELYLETFAMRIEDAISDNYTKQLNCWKLHDETAQSDAKRSYIWENIEALQAEETALRQLYATIKKDLGKEREY